MNAVDKARESERIVYKSFMTDVKARYMAILALDHACQEMNQQIVYELKALQLRFACEGIALACLAAHDYIPEISNSKVGDAYEPGRIMRKLSEIHHNFYPIPHTGEKVGNTWYLTKSENEVQFLTREMLIKLWNRLGSVLHLGTLADFRSGKKFKNPKPVDLDSAVSALAGLLGTHSIHTRGRTHVLLFDGRLDEPTKEVRCALAVVT